MADEDSRNEDAPKRPGKSSKKDKKADSAKDKAKSKGKSGDDAKSAKDADDESTKDAKDSKSGKKGVTKAASSAKATKTDDKKDDKKSGEPRRGFWPFRFIREIVEQLRKVVYPTRKELLTYTLVVIVFVTIMISVISGFDFTFNRAVQLIFGSSGDA